MLEPLKAEDFEMLEATAATNFKGTEWACIEGQPGQIHVVPINDIRYHYMHQSCPCRVRLKCETARQECGHLQMGRTYIHNAWDGRE